MNLGAFAGLMQFGESFRTLFNSLETREASETAVPSSRGGGLRPILYDFVFDGGA